MFYGLALSIVVAYLLWEARRLARARDSVVIRVHVHGTRGKTSTVRRAAELLRNAGLRVLAKTTGDNPEYIFPDGSVRPIHRIGPARITEHVKALLLAKRLGVDALVVEGMALQRENIAVSEQILRATHAAVVNVRPDHAETMGEGYKGVARTLSLMIPRKGRFFTTSEKTEILQATARAKGIDTVVVEAGAMEHAERIAYALASDILLSRGVAAPQAIVRSPPLSAPKSLHLEGFPLDFVDLFSANDVVSTGLLCEAVGQLREKTSLKVAFFASRADRPLRTLAFVRMLVASRDFDIIAFGGSHRFFAKAYVGIFAREALLRFDSVGADAVSTLRRWSDSAKARGKTRLLVVGMGNTHGVGESWRVALCHWEEGKDAH